MSNDFLEQIEACPMVKNIPTGISHLLKVLTEEDTDIDELIGLLNKFPVVCVRLILVANSAWAAPKVEITDVKRACMQLGLKMVKSISIALLVSQQFNAQKCKGFSERTFWLSSLVTADLMVLMQQSSDHKNTDSASAHLIGLIHNLGLLAIADIAPEKISQAILKSNNSDTSFRDALTQAIGVSYLQVTQMILTNWGLPNIINASFYLNVHSSPYCDLLGESIVKRNQLNLDVVPITLIDEAAEASSDLNEIISNSSVYDELCGMYCR